MKIFQHIVISSNGSGFDVVVDQDEGTKKHFASYNGALFYAVRFLASCALDTGQAR